MSIADDAQSSGGPARPAKLTVDFFEEPDGVAIHVKRGGGAGCFLLLWLIGWTVGCVALLAKAIDDPSIGTLLFAVPFWASWLFVAAIVVWSFFGKETLLLRHHDALFVRKAFIQLKSRAVPREEIQSFRECRSNHTENDEYLWGIEMVTLGKPLRFAFRLPDREREWLIYRLNAFLGVDHAPTPPLEQAERAVIERKVGVGRLRPKTSPSDSPMESETLDRNSVLETPPSDSRWALVDEIHEFEFRQRGKLELGSLLGLLFINAFWNGIVSVFVLVQWGVMPAQNAPQWNEPGWWGLFVFLIPFEVIGLLMFAALLVALLEPFRRTSWRCEQDRITWRWRWPFFSRSKSWEFEKLGRMELRIVEGKARKLRSNVDFTTSGQAGFSLALVATDNVDLCEIDELSEGEARWMAGVILDRRPRWFT